MLNNFTEKKLRGRSLAAVLPRLTRLRVANSIELEIDEINTHDLALPTGIVGGM